MVCEVTRRHTAFDGRCARLMRNEYGKCRSNSFRTIQRPTALSTVVLWPYTDTDRGCYYDSLPLWVHACCILEHIHRVLVPLDLLPPVASVSMPSASPSMYTFVPLLHTQPWGLSSAHGASSLVRCKWWIRTLRRGVHFGCCPYFAGYSSYSTTRYF